MSFVDMQVCYHPTSPPIKKLPWHMTVVNFTNPVIQTIYLVGVAIVKFKGFVTPSTGEATLYLSSTDFAYLCSEFQQPGCVDIQISYDDTCADDDKPITDYQFPLVPAPAEAILFGIASGVKELVQAVPKNLSADLASIQSELALIHNKVDRIYNLLERAPR